MRRLFRALALLCLLLPPIHLLGQGQEVKAQLVKSEHQRKGETGKLSSDKSDLLFFLDQQNTFLKIHNSDITEIHCKEEKEWFRIWKLLFPPALLARQILHYVTVEYSDGEGERQSTVFLFDESAFVEAIKMIEESTGRKVG